MAFEILTSNQGILETRMSEAIVLKPLNSYTPKNTLLLNLTCGLPKPTYTHIYVNILVIGNERILSPSLLVYCAFCFLLRAIDNKLEGGDWGQPKIITQELDTSCVCVDQESMQLIFLSQSSWNRSDFLLHSHYWRKTGLRNHQIQTQQSYKGPSASD